MTHDDLLDKLNRVWDREPNETQWELIEKLRNALRAVVEKHTPFTPEFGGGIDYCWADDRPYPCPTIQAIEKELG